MEVKWIAVLLLGIAVGTLYLFIHPFKPWTGEVEEEKEECPWLNVSYWKQHPLRGVVIELRDNPPALEELKLIKKLGANVVVLEIQYTWRMEKPYKRDEKAMALLRESLENVEKAGLHAIVGIRNGPGRTDMYCCWEGENILDIYHEREAMDAWLEMIKDTLSEIKGSRGLIGFDPMVEPAPSLYYGEDREGRMKGFEWWNNFSGECIEAIREVSDVPIVLEAADWSSVYGFTHLKIRDGNIAYNIHSYWPYEYTHNEEGYTYPGEMCYWDVEKDVCEYVDKKALERHWEDVDRIERENNITIFIGEWGGIRFIPSLPRYIKDMIETMEERGWSWSYYAWGEDPGWKPSGFTLSYGPLLGSHSLKLNSSTFLPIRKAWEKNEEVECP